MHMRHALVLVVLASTACYTYQPVAAPGPREGARVTAGLTQDGATELTPLLGEGVGEVSGDVRSATPDTLRLSLVSVTSVRGIPTSWRGEEVPLPRARLAYLGERRLSRGGTALLGVSIAGGLYLLYRLMGGPGILESSGGGSGGGGQ
jgi:hypothetical protein